MWEKGTINGYDFCVKYYDKPVECGLNGGRIAKLEIRRNNRIVYGYERGETFPVQDDATYDVLDYIVTVYN